MGTELTSMRRALLSRPAGLDAGGALRSLACCALPVSIGIPLSPAEPDRPPICIALLLLRVGVGGWSFKQVAAAAGISPRLVSAYERGAEPLSRERLDGIAAAMGFSPEEVELALRTGEVLDRSRSGAAQAMPPHHPRSRSNGTTSRR